MCHFRVVIHIGGSYSGVFEGEIAVWEPDNLTKIGRVQSLWMTFLVLHFLVSLVGVGVG